MRCYYRSLLSAWDTRTTDDKRDMDIFFDAAFFSGLKPVLADVVAIIGRIYYVGVVENTIGG